MVLTYRSDWGRRPEASGVSKRNSSMTLPVRRKFTTNKWDGVDDPGSDASETPRGWRSVAAGNPLMSSSCTAFDYTKIHPVSLVAMREQNGDRAGFGGRQDGGPGRGGEDSAIFDIAQKRKEKKRNDKRTLTS
jgi:hypothetical protein